ncbi:KamA family radical SAM protein [Umezawaea endophytica]|uniref:Lysine 2,3-aminomutase n=1 Tax=Umezawaea endophytica TaxID=1654476 RepID=A0A9X2ZYV8_9PSEU|nr:lysine 2,3-aminomutase [Umezawaea endophytica]MCS7476819.1 lysine 2,3-aminomutase [Umezawaea endophytica]
MTTVSGDVAPSAVPGRRLADLVRARGAGADLAHEVDVVSRVLPFKVSAHALENLIDWDAAPDDPMYRLLFPHRDMLLPADFALVERSLGDPAALRAAVAEVRARLNPHPGDQLSRNVPKEQPGLQHKYAETVLVFPKQGQTCHSYCAYCFRWAQFIGDAELKLAVDGPDAMADYLRAHPEVTDVLITGGDPLIMKTDLLARYVDAALAVDHIRTIRIGTKALSFHPARVAVGPDAADLLRLAERVVAAGRHLAFMLHFSHPREMEPELTRTAIRLLGGTGAQLRSQAPVVRHVNDDPAIWSRMWTDQVNAGIHPYYMFVERDTGAQHYFGLPLERAHEVYRDAVSRVSGLARTARGPVMSAAPGKVVVDGPVKLPHGTAFALRFLQARDPSLVGRPFYAKWDPAAQWWDDLVPLDEHDRSFFEENT